MATFPRSGRLGHPAPKPTHKPRPARAQRGDTVAAAALSAATAQWPPRPGYPATLRGGQPPAQGAFSVGPPRSAAKYETDSLMSMDESEEEPLSMSWPMSASANKAAAFSASHAIGRNARKQPVPTANVDPAVDARISSPKGAKGDLRSLLDGTSEPQYAEDEDCEAINRSIDDVGSLIQQDAMLAAELAWWESYAKEEQNFRDCYEAELAAQRRCVNCEMQGLHEEMQIVQQQTKLNNKMQNEWALKIERLYKETRYAENIFKKYEKESASAAKANESLRSEIRAESSSTATAKLGPLKSGAVERDTSIGAPFVQRGAEQLRFIVEQNKNNLMNDYDADHFRDTVANAIASHLYPLPKVEKLHVCVAHVVNSFADRDEVLTQSEEKTAAAAATKLQALFRGRLDRKKARNKNESIITIFKNTLPQLKSHYALKDQAIIGIVGGHDFVNWNSDDLIKFLGERCGRDFDARAKFLTYAQPGVQATFAQACGDGSTVVNLVSDGVAIPQDYNRVGVNISVDRTVRKALFNHLADIYLLVEVGSDEALTVDMVMKRDAVVVPIAPTRGFPHRAWEKPSFVTEASWRVLREGSTSDAIKLTGAVVEILEAFLERWKREKAEKAAKAAKAASGREISAERRAELELQVQELFEGREPAAMPRIGDSVKLLSVKGGSDFRLQGKTGKVAGKETASQTGEAAFSVQVDGKNISLWRSDLKILETTAPVDEGSLSFPSTLTGIERSIVHIAVGRYEGLVSSSHGEGQDRYVRVDRRAKGLSRNNTAEET